MFFYLKLQFKRIYRIIKDFGMPPYLGMVLIVLFFIKCSNIFFTKTPNASLFYSVIAIFYVLYLGNSEKNNFIKTVFSKKDFRKIRLLENILITMPFAVFLMYKTAFLYAFSVVFLSGILSAFNTARKMSIVIPTPFYKYPFEFIIGFRRLFYVVFMTYGLTIVAVKVRNFNLGIFSLCVLGVLIPEFYKKAEPKTFVWIHNLNAKLFLRKKITTAFLYSLLLSIPIHVLLWIAFPTKFYITLIFQGLAFCFLIACIFGKYKHFPNQMLITTGITIVVCLLFPPLFIVVIPYIYNEALTNLRKLL